MHKVSDFHFDLPEALIAQYPTAKRTGSRLLCLDRQTGAVAHRQFPDLIDLLQPNDLLVLNNTKVIPARLFGQKASGGKVEVLVERVLDSQRVLAHVRASKSPKPGTRLLLAEAITVEVLGRQGELFELQFAPEKTAADWLTEYGHMPLPPYIERSDNTEDAERYQTVYAKHAGAVAAPTAGLHFDEVLLERIKQLGVETAFVTLHVGAGTFQPVRVEHLSEHRMHHEWLTVSATTCEAMARAKQRGGRVIAVGTTSVRALETASQSGELQPYQGETNIFIYPGYQFRAIDALLTNFHLPESTLIMLVAAFAGYEATMAAYRTAVEQQYRFFSYGDAMFISNEK